MRICSGAGCLRAVEDTVRFCDECKPVRVGPTDDGIRNHSAAYDADITALGKTKRWQDLRTRAIRKHPLCARCDRAVSEIVNHIVPAREAIAQARVSGTYRMDKWAGYFFLSNLQGLCRPCHWTKTNEDKLHVGPWPDVVAVEAAAPKRRWSF